MKKTLLALGLAATTLLTATLTGCLNSENSPSSDDLDDPTVTTPSTTTATTKNPDEWEIEPFVPNPDFSIDEENITAEQVLANLDEMAADFANMKKHTGAEIDRERSNFWATFTSFSPQILRFEDSDINKPVYNIYSPLEIDKRPNQHWFNSEESPYYQKNTDAIDGYYTTLLLRYSEWDRVSDLKLTGIIMPQKEYEAMLESFGVKKHVLTLDEIKDNSDYIYWLDNLNTEVYDAFTLDREKIENATKEQLRTIHNLLNAMYNINLIGTNTPVE